MSDLQQDGGNAPLNPLEPSVKLGQPSDTVNSAVHPQNEPLEGDSAVTKAEKFERRSKEDELEESPAKRRKTDAGLRNEDQSLTKGERQKGVAPIKPEFLISQPGSRINQSTSVVDDDTAEGAAHTDQDRGSRRRQRTEKARGQNTARHFGSSRDVVALCASRANSPEFSPKDCQYGSDCKFEHDLRKYLKEWKRADLTTFDGQCPIWKMKGKCDVGWKCRFVGSHSKEVKLDVGREELQLIEEFSMTGIERSPGISDMGTINEISLQAKNDLMKHKIETPKADAYIKWIDINSKEVEKLNRKTAKERRYEVEHQADKDGEKDALQSHRAQFTKPPLMPSEKRKIYFGPETPVLAPLTTQGNLPFRRLCVGLGAQLTYSEMAMGLPLLQGSKPEWALMRGHESEAKAPIFNSGKGVVKDYENTRDFRFGAQIAANKPWQALKAAETLTALCSHLRVIDLNCGCPIDLVYRQGAGSALLDSQAKLEKMIRGMNAVSGEIPITVKIRMGTKDNKPNALKLVDRLVYGGEEAVKSGEGSCGAAAITLHGRSRQQRYTKDADWSYISDCAALINEYNERGDDLTDTVREAEGRTQPASGKVYFLGNGDCYSHVDYTTHLQEAKVDSVMIARGALIKPWIFEEIQQGQYIDKSASERLALIEQYVHHGLETWGSDEHGIGITRRFLLEWLSFAYRYVPVGILEHLPPKLQDRPPAWRGRNDLETLLGSDNYKDWIKISEMFLGPAHENFNFQPKHKSNSYEIEAEG